MIRILFTIFLLLGGAGAVSLGPYEIDYAAPGNAIWTPVAKSNITADGVAARGYAGIVLAADGWVLLILNDFDEPVALSEDDAFGMMKTAPVARVPVSIDGCETVLVSDGFFWRSVWTLQADGWEDGYMIGSDTVAVTMGGGWSRSDAVEFVESVRIGR